MILPVRCFTCNKIISNKWNKYHELTNLGKKPEIVFKDLNINLYCCKRMFLCHVNIIDKINK